MDVSSENRDIQSQVLFHLEGVKNADRAAGDILQKVNDLNIKMAVRILAEVMLKEEVTEEIRGAASTVLLALAGRHFNDVMYELQKNVKTVKLPHRMVFQTLGSLASHYGKALSSLCGGIVLWKKREGWDLIRCHRGDSQSKGMV
uniref:Uncharacterized protein n=1 Tax=Sphaerodactylus townsendi TaxID=933632 RepID=A0ACB8G5S5_9SAUR